MARGRYIAVYNTYQEVESFTNGVIVERIFDEVSLDEGIEIYADEDSMKLNVDGHTLQLEELREIGGVYNPWTIVHFRVPEERALLYIFRGDGCEVHITACSNGIHYIKILGSNNVGDIYIS